MLREVVILLTWGRYSIGFFHNWDTIVVGHGDVFILRGTTIFGDSNGHCHVTKRVKGVLVFHVIQGNKSPGRHFSGVFVLLVCIFGLNGFLVRTGTFFVYFLHRGTCTSKVVLLIVGGLNHVVVPYKFFLGVHHLGVEVMVTIFSVDGRYFGRYTSTTSHHLVFTTMERGSVVVFTTFFRVVCRVRVHMVGTTIVTQRFGKFCIFATRVGQVVNLCIRVTRFIVKGTMVERGNF